MGEPAPSDNLNMSSPSITIIGPSTADITIPFTARFSDKSPDGARRRSIYLKVLIGGLVMTVLAMYAIFSIFWGALYKAPARNLDGWVVDFDGQQVGQAVVQGLNAASHQGKVTWNTMSKDQFPNGPSDVAAAVVNQKTWVAITINPSATNNLANATNRADNAYKGASAISVYADEARSENGYRSVIRPSFDAALQQISQRFAQQYVAQLRDATVIQNLAQFAPQVITQPIFYTIFNERPFDVPVATAATFVGLIYLVILSFFVVMISNGARDASGIGAELSTASLIRVRIVTSVVAYLFLSLFYSSLSPAFGLPVTRAFGHAGFMVFWMLNWAGMLALGLALESMITILTSRFIGFFMLLWIIVNVSVCFLPIEVLPIVFRYGFATPFYNISKAIRTIVFNTQNDLGLNFGVLIAWTTISLITLPLFQMIVRNREIDAAEKQRIQREKEPRKELEEI